MTIRHVKITKDNLNWLINRFSKDFINEWGDKPTPSHLVNLGIKQLISQIDGTEFKVKYSTKRKCLTIKKI